MKAVIQRVAKAGVRVNQETVGEIKEGILAFIGVTHEDTEADVEYLANKIMNLRIFEDENEKMNLSLKDINGCLLSVSQFTLYGDTRKGRRPNFMGAARPEVAKNYYESFNKQVRQAGVTVETGVFGAMMEVDSINDGPVTLIIDSKEK
ncbi:D-tyrosyl-tRNA(Tyr) deacylase [Paraliobacillus sp. PM-2]|uniref:D-aminoacyl-tRNA deacylase n=1 Tax=Paraliobacillus sp. PM-2 TaxID=1462524 RepID=UPI00061C8B32|nr:D-aminoacyl-tRNA deacylase [Paraliobacillus sp. PM-2]CQR46944.1 D-tyrosyl-tRNA(Tyr) deacylase [Paraliobacillus sp. PM-2]